MTEPVRYLTHTEIYRNALFTPKQTLTIWLAYCWLLGAFSLSLVAGVIENLPGDTLGDLRDEMEHARNHLYAGEYAPASRLAWRYLLQPTLVQVTHALFRPLMTAYLCLLCLKDVDGPIGRNVKQVVFILETTRIVRHVLGPVITKKWQTWLEQKRDEKFVVSRRLLDFVPQ